MFLRPKSPKPPSDPLDMTLLHWSKDDPFTVRDLINGGAAIWGRTGAGKSSASGKRLMRALIENGNIGLLILAAKPEDADDVRALFDRAGQSDKLLVVNDDGELRFNFLDYVRKLGGDTRDIAKTLNVIGESLNSSDSDGREEGSFWQGQQEMMTYNAVECVKRGTGQVSAPDLLNFILGAAREPKDFFNEQFRAGFHYQVLQRALDAAKATTSKREQYDFELARAFWVKSLPLVAQKTRSVIESSVLRLLHFFNVGIVRELCSTTTNVSPDDLLTGRSILINLPPSKYGESAKFLGAGWRYLTQKMIMQRKARSGDPVVVIWCDEAQQWVNSHDSHFMAQCRSHLGCQVFLTQSLSSIFAELLSKKGEHVGKALIGNFTTRIFHALGNYEDAEFASKLIGEAPQMFINGSAGPQDDLFSGLMGLSHYSGGFSEQMQPIVMPQVFMNGLRTGSKLNNYMVDAVVVKSGEPFANGQNFKFVCFDQRS